MTRTKILTELKKFFPSTKELVCDHIYARFSESAWFLLPTFWLYTLLIIRRDILKSGMICNSYGSSNGVYKQRGCRCNLCQIVRDETANGRTYQSAHTKHIGGDFTVIGMTALEARNKIAQNEHLLPYNIRLEQDVTWLHIDVYDYDNGKKITYFKG